MVRWGALLSAAAEGKKVNKFYYKARACVCVCIAYGGYVCVCVCVVGAGFANVATVGRPCEPVIKKANHYPAGYFFFISGIEKEEKKANGINLGAKHETSASKSNSVVFF